MPFPKDFVWAASAASYQIEGAVGQDGAGLSVWDTFCTKPGAILTGDDGSVACDHYHRYKEDVAIMKQMGLKAYRLSISWPRVLPDGTGKPNEKGLAFYDALIDELIAAGIEPYVTLFHWDYPQQLFLKDGWLNPKSSDWFAEYTKLIIERLSDRVKNWITLNEPQCFVGLGHMDGLHAPGLKLAMPDALVVAHNVLLAHGKAVRTIREHAKQTPTVGYAPVAVIHTPATDSPGDIEACKKAMFTVSEATWKEIGNDIQSSLFRNNTWWMDPIFLGHYPQNALAAYGDNMCAYSQTDMDIISEKVDFLGLNSYFGPRSKLHEDGNIQNLPDPTGHVHTTMDWPRNPDILYWGPKFFYERYNVPIVITENGMANMDWVHFDGQVHDPQRIDYIRRHLLRLRDTIDDGVDVRGYFYWSIMDNFEWWHGYSQRFGLVFTDYETLKRIPKDSAKWYSQVIASNGESLDKA